MFALGATQLTGRAVDRWGSLRIGALAVIVFVVVVGGLVVREGALPLTLGFVLLLCSLQSRNVTVRALSTRVPRPEERGRFMSLLSAAQQLGTAAGAIGSSGLLRARSDGRLDGMPGVGALALVLALATLPLLALVDRGAADTGERPQPT